MYTSIVPLELDHSRTGRAALPKFWNEGKKRTFLLEATQNAELNPTLGQY